MSLLFPIDKKAILFEPAKKNAFSCKITTPEGIFPETVDGGTGKLSLFFNLVELFSKIIPFTLTNDLRLKVW